MIITCDKKLEIGKVYSQDDFATPLSSRDTSIYVFAFLVLRESNRNEYINYAINICPDENQSMLILKEYFYEVSAD